MQRLLAILIFNLLASASFAQTLVTVRTAVAPKYPSIAKAERASEMITVKVIISAPGVVTAAVASSGANVFLRKASEEAAMRWTFEGSTSEARETTLKFVYVILDGALEADPEVEFRPPFEVVIRKHPGNTSGPLAANADVTIGGLSHESHHVVGRSAPR